jgi:hypothetical protein
LCRRSAVAICFVQAVIVDRFGGSHGGQELAETLTRALTLFEPVAMSARNLASRQRRAYTLHLRDVLGYLEHPGADLKAVQETLGHISLATTRSMFLWQSRHRTRYTGARLVNSRYSIFSRLHTILRDHPYDDGSD